MKKHRCQTLQSATDTQYLLLENQMIKAVPINLMTNDIHFGILVPKELLQKFFYEKNVESQVVKQAFWAFWCRDAETAEHVYSRLKSDDLTKGVIEIDNRKSRLLGLLVDHWTFQIVE